MSSSWYPPNTALLLAAAKRLAPLLDEIVFVGGCAAALLITDPAAPPVRTTLDVDAIAVVASYAEWTLLEARLRQLGFRQPPGETIPVCRWIHDDVVLDLMPSEASILGFSNRWYRPAFDHAQIVTVGGLGVRLIRAPYFLATKLEAFRSRGKNDYRLSRDLEDIVAVIDGRTEIVQDVSESAEDLQAYLGTEFSALLVNQVFLEALSGYLLPDAVSQQRVSIVVERLRQLALGG